VIQPKREVGRFKGEPVYRRANVLACRTAENWMRVGRRVKDRQEPMKWIKQRAVTIQKRRAQELAMQETGEAIQQGLYAENQTELYIPPPIVDVSQRECHPANTQGKIPQNSFGNIDLYVPTMLPAGAVHLPCLFTRCCWLTSRQGYCKGGEEDGGELRRGSCEFSARFAR
jgi:xeroderma pigmentosum group C-complementing protein